MYPLSRSLRSVVQGFPRHVGAFPPEIYLLNVTNLSVSLIFTDLCGYVRSLLGVDTAIFNLMPVTQLLKTPDDSMGQVMKCWKDEDEQLEIVLQNWRKENDMVKDLATLRKDLEGLKQEGRLS